MQSPPQSWTKKWVILASPYITLLSISTTPFGVDSKPPTVSSSQPIHLATIILEAFINFTQCTMHFDLFKPLKDLENEIQWEFLSWRIREPQGVNFHGSRSLLRNTNESQATLLVFITLKYLNMALQGEHSGICLKSHEKKGGWGRRLMNLWTGEKTQKYPCLGGRKTDSQQIVKIYLQWHFLEANTLTHKKKKNLCLALHFMDWDIK